ncbi:MAG: diguanylate cyclase [Solirubrobacterales bacterium]|nr:diguanylate cyclase [Solirubrobacterales bacterium]
MAQPAVAPALDDLPQQVRALAYLYLGGAGLALAATLLMPRPPGLKLTATLALIAFAAAVGLLLLMTRKRLPPWTPALAVALGTVVISVDLYVAGGSITDNEMFYVFVGFYAFHFLRVGVALAEIAFVGLCYAIALSLTSMPDAPGRWLVTMGTLVVTGLLIAQLVARLERWVHHSRQREEELRQVEERFRSAFDNAPIGMALTGLDGRWLRVNEALAQLTGYDKRALVGMSFRDLTPPDDVAGDLEALNDLVSGKRDTYHAEKRYVRANGEMVWISLGVSVISDHDGAPMHLISQMQDITSRKATEHELALRALHDPLTGLPNRVLFGDRLDVALAHIVRSRQPLAVFFIDLDRFKLINDSFGHGVGDRMLVQIAERLLELLRPADTVCRFGGDEFTVLCESTDERAATEIAQRILEALSAPLSDEELEVHANASIGVAVTRDPTITVDALLHEADQAMYRAKQQGGARVAISGEGEPVQLPALHTGEA